MAKKEDRSNAVMLEMLGDLPSAGELLNDVTYITYKIFSFWVIFSTVVPL